MPPQLSDLPLPLLLLVHLHILNYPHANEPQYDNHIFDARLKGLKDRMKMMEDICYFLVSQLENNARNILSMYPCSQPSESLAFRTSLSKYLETLRHQALFSSSSSSSSSHASSTSVRRTHDGQQGVSGQAATAWWWKDVVVRKSLLEECTGIKFERMLVAFSTHVLLQKSRPRTQDQLFGLATTIPVSYTDRLAQCQRLRREWVQRASLLSYRRQNLQVMQNIISRGKTDSMLWSLSLDHLRALTERKYSDIQSRFWPGDRGSASLIQFVRLAGLTLPLSGSSPPEVDAKMLDLHQNEAQATPPLLPIAAAHHPAELKRLRRSVFPSAGSVRVDNPDGKQNLPGQCARALLSDDLLSEKRMHRRLSQALSDIRQAHGRFSKALRSRALNPHLSRRLWRSEIIPGKDLMQKPIINRELFERLSLPYYDAPEGFEQRIDRIRQELLPQYPSAPNLHGPRVTRPESPNLPSQIPRLKPPRRLKQEGPDFAEAETPRKAEVRAKPRKSIKVALALNMARLSSEEENNVFSDEAFKIISATKDDSTENIDFTTPRSKAPPNRIWTSGQKKTPVSVIRAPRRSIPMLFEEPEVRLPLIPATSTGSMSLLDQEDELEPERNDAFEISWSDEQSQTSMTLREILLSADTSHFDLIDDEAEEYVEEFSGWE